jgi:hypothetical protein
VAKSRVVQRDRGARALVKAIRDASAGLKVGLVGDAAFAAAHDAPGLTVAQLGEIHEYGIGNVPERSFIRKTIDAQAPQLVTMVREGAAAIAKGRATPEIVLNRLGAHIAGLIQAAMSEGIPPPLSPAYLKQKLRKFPGAETPLIASGQLRQAVTWKFDPRASERGRA